MAAIALVTGNLNKLKELKLIAPKNLRFVARQIDLPEIQSLDIYEIVEDKVKRAYEILKEPVIVDDVSAGLDDLANLPGPFYKFFHQQLGSSILLKLASISSDKITIRCLAAYYDGQDLITGEGILHGKIVEPRGDNGFGFDPVIVPVGSRRTLAEMSPEEKNAISHRGLAFKDLLDKLASLE